jgi:hypothetical protein
MKIIKSKKWEDKLKGGLADQKTPNDYNQRQLRKGIEVELEHTDDPDIATEIAMDHLEESKDYRRKTDGGKYYDRLERMEENIEENIEEDTEEYNRPRQGKGRRSRRKPLGLCPGRPDRAGPFRRNLSYASRSKEAQINDLTDYLNSQQMNEDAFENREDQFKEEDSPFDQGYEQARLDYGRTPNKIQEIPNLPPVGYKPKDADEAFGLEYWKGYQQFFDDMELPKPKQASKRTKKAKKDDEDWEYNPWAVCTESVGREDKEKYEECVRQVKKKQKKKSSKNTKLKKKAKEDRWMQDAVDEEDEGKFTSWCKRHGHRGVNQACINEAAKEGGHAARMANFAVNANPDKWSYPDDS